MAISISHAETVGLPINQQAAFSNPKGEFKERIKKRQLKMLQKYAPMLNHQMEPGEEIQLAMRGCSPMSLLEQLTTGWIVYLLKRCTLVVTNKRILHFPSKTNFTPKHSVSQIRFGDLELIKPSAFLGRRFTVKYKNGKKETFLYVKEARKLKALLPTLTLHGDQTTLFRTRHHLCPKCTAPLEPGVYTCWKCALEFKNMKTGALLSIFLPGGGYFYTRHPFLGLGDAIGEVLLLVIFVFSLAGLLFGTADPVGSIMLVVVFGILLFIEKVITVYHTKHFIKEYIPVDEHFQPIRRG